MKTSSRLCSRNDFQRYRKKEMNRKQEKPIVALIYDFDGTLAPGNMQEYSFISAVGRNKDEFWGETHEMARHQDADGVLIYMLLMLEEAKRKGIKLTKRKLKTFGKDITFFNGVETWFERINKIGEKEGVTVEHKFLRSSGNYGRHQHFKGIQGHLRQFFLLRRGRLRNLAGLCRELHQQDSVSFQDKQRHPQHPRQREDKRLRA